ncbi:MAG: SDR family oxidoreductase [Streptosporangiales bacterium]|nr:SDR family oxidoreductase [Streptosporangiales bacterium]
MDSRLVVVTGGGQGIGLAIAHRLASDGSRVAVLDLNGESAGKAASGLPEGQGYAYQCDVTDYTQVAAVARTVVDELGVPEVVVANVGWSPDRRYLDTSLEEQQKLIEVNFTGSLHVTRAFLPEMVEARDGRLVYISSDAARVGVPGEAVYAGAKAGLIGYAKSMAVELARYAITVNVVCPGSTDTPLLHGMFSAEGIEKRVKAHPMRRLAKPDDIATAVQYFASRDASFVTGQIISVNGGMLRAG